jgi:hypothetical protein
MTFSVERLSRSGSNVQPASRAFVMPGGDPVIVVVIIELAFELKPSLRPSRTASAAT